MPPTAKSRPANTERLCRSISPRFSANGLGPSLPESLDLGFLEFDVLAHDGVIFAL